MTDTVLLSDSELVAELTRRKGGGRPPFSVSFLRKDRVGSQIIPFVRVGNLCLYNPDRVIASLQAREHGGRAKVAA